MAKFKNTSPLGDLEVPALGRAIKAGEEFDVPDAEAEGFLAFTPVDKVAKAAAAAYAAEADGGAAEPDSGAADQAGETGKTTKAGKAAKAGGQTEGV
jgi:hypothetical protein